MPDTNNLSLYDTLPNLKSTPSTCLFQAGTFLTIILNYGEKKKKKKKEKKRKKSLLQ